MKAFWHRLLLLLRIRDRFDWAGPDLGPEVPHPYIQHPTLRCCKHCGGGKLNAIHKPPFNPRRSLEVLAGYSRYPGEPLPNFQTGAGVREYVERGPAAALPGEPDSAERMEWFDHLHADILRAAELPRPSFPPPQDVHMKDSGLRERIA